MDNKKVSDFANNYIHVYSEGIDELGDMTQEEHVAGLIIAAYRWAIMEDIDPYTITFEVAAWTRMEEE